MNKKLKNINVEVTPQLLRQIDKMAKEVKKDRKRWVIDACVKEMTYQDELREQGLIKPVIR